VFLNGGYGLVLLSVLFFMSGFRFVFEQMAVLFYVTGRSL
jgi:hypothetical protein